MSVKIRLRRDGAKKRPFYHLVAADERRARNGRFIEELGYYNPMVAADAEPILVLKDDRIRYWLGVGAQPSETAAALLKKKGLIERRTAVVAKGAAAPAETTEPVVAESAAAESAVISPETDLSPTEESTVEDSSAS